MKLFWIFFGIGFIIAIIIILLWSSDLNYRREMAIGIHDQKIYQYNLYIQESSNKLKTLGSSKGHGPVVCKDKNANYLSSLRASSDQNTDIWYNICCPFFRGSCWIEL